MHASFLALSVKLCRKVEIQCNKNIAIRIIKIACIIEQQLFLKVQFLKWDNANLEIYSPY